MCLVSFLLLALTVWALYLFVTRNASIAVLVLAILGVIVWIGLSILLCGTYASSRMFQTIQDAVKENWNDPESVLVLTISAARVARFVEDTYGLHGSRSREALWLCGCFELLFIGPLGAGFFYLQAWIRGLTSAMSSWSVLAIGYSIGVGVVLLMRFSALMFAASRWIRYRRRPDDQPLVIFCKSGGGAAVFFQEEAFLARPQSQDSNGCCDSAINLRSYIEQRGDDWVFVCQALDDDGDAEFPDLLSEEFPLDAGQKDDVLAWLARSEDARAAFGLPLAEPDLEEPVPDPEES